MFSFRKACFDALRVDYFKESGLIQCEDGR